MDTSTTILAIIVALMVVERLWPHIAAIWQSEHDRDFTRSVQASEKVDVRHTEFFRILRDRDAELLSILREHSTSTAEMSASLSALTTTLSTLTSRLDTIDDRHDRAAVRTASQLEDLANDVADMRQDVAHDIQDIKHFNTVLIEKFMTHQSKGERTDG